MSPKIISVSLLAIMVCTSAVAEMTGVDLQNKRIVVSITQEPGSLNTLTAESVSYTAQLLVHLNEGLMRYDGRRNLVGGVAESWEMTNEKSASSYARMPGGKMEIQSGRRILCSPGNSC